jgi:hypothetical protein
MPTDVGFFKLSCASFVAACTLAFAADPPLVPEEVPEELLFFEELHPDTATASAMTATAVTRTCLGRIEVLSPFLVS